ncbi:MAG: ribosome silencing factor [Candidatus Omnitrophica bacterium]|nr:ribosome silencing factor [Candidatus Omnitrophota bacterium]
MARTGTIRKKELNSQGLAEKIAKLANDKKAEDIVILDMRQMVNFCDFFIIATGTSDRHIKAIAEGVDEGLNNKGNGKSRNLDKSGVLLAQENGAWVILDLGNVVVHVFEPRSREFYALEHLWQDAPRLEYKISRRKKV